MINLIKIELNRAIISNEDYVYYSNIIPHLLENSKNDDLLYRAGKPDIKSESTAVIIYQQASYINFKIDNDSLIVTKTY